MLGLLCKVTFLRVICWVVYASPKVTFLRVICWVVYASPVFVLHTNYDLIGVNKQIIINNDN